MRFSWSRIGAITILGLFVAATAGCSLANKIRAKNELNETAKAYKAGQFDVAEQHAKRAPYLDPGNPTAPIFIARVIHQQYKPGVDQPDNIQRAKDAIEAYQYVLRTDPNNEEAYKAISVLYSAIKDEQNLRSWIMKRAGDASQPPEKRAEAYAILAGKDWDCSYKVTELPDIKTTTTDAAAGKATVTYKKPKEQKDFDNIQKCVVRGLEEADTAIKFDPNTESGWSYKANLLLEAAKQAEMDGKPDQKKTYEAQAKTAQERAGKLSEERRKKEEAAEAAAGTPTP
jgi:tetratricopeptide (TPR) repeat protein